MLTEGHSGTRTCPTAALDTLFKKREKNLVSDCEGKGKVVPML